MQRLPSNDNHEAQLNNDIDNRRPNDYHYRDGRRVTHSNYFYSVAAEEREPLSDFGAQSGGIKTAPSFARSPLHLRTLRAIA